LHNACRMHDVSRMSIVYAYVLHNVGYMHMHNACNKYV